MILAWLIICLIAIFIGFAFSIIFPSNFEWFMQLRRPRWLTFEAAIPFIWLFIFFCGISSAALIWQRQPGTFKTWLIMSGYGIVECAILAYTPVLTRLRNIRLGAVVGASGFILGVILTNQVWQLSNGAGWLLMPYLLWSPVGTYVTWVMARLNPS